MLYSICFYYTREDLFLCYNCFKISFPCGNQMEKTELRKLGHLGSSVTNTFYTQFSLTGGQLSHLYGKRH